MSPPARPPAGRGRGGFAPAGPPRMRRILILALLATLPIGVWLVFLRGDGPDFRRTANLTAPGETVVFLGDSITRGYGLSEGEAFPALVAAALGVPFVNAGVSGDTTATALARLERDVLAHRPRLTVVELGGNDYLRRVPVEETLRNLDAILRELATQGGMVVLLHVSLGLVGDPYLEGFRAAAERHGALLVPDVLRGILSSPDLKLDPIHPNAKGQRLIAERVAGALGPLLREAERRRGGAR